MTLVTARAGGNLNMDVPFDLLLYDNAVTQTQSATLLVVDAEGVRFTFTGFGVRYNGFGEPIAGTITGVQAANGPSVFFEISGISVSASQFYASIETGVLALLLPGNDELRGGDQFDQIYDSSGHNNAYGGGGRDFIILGDGNDHIYGHSPNGGQDEGDLLQGRGGSDYIQGNAGNDNIHGGDGADRVNGGADQDWLFGDAGNDSMNGNRGDDTVEGGGGNDLLRGGQGDDRLSGEDGDDILSGDLGADTLSGGSGDDVFLFAGASSPIGGEIDKIFDFGTGADRISLGFLPQIILSGTLTSGGQEALLALAQSLFDQNPGDYEVAVVQANGSRPLLFWSSTGGGQIDSVMSAGLYSYEFALDDFV